MAIYNGLNLKSEVRESISVDEDDLSDVEDEVFIRDGKNGYRIADEINVKRPLMAPRRKPTNKITIATRLKNRPFCRRCCKPCCYTTAAFTIFLGFIVLVVILVSLFPLPIEKFRSWFHVDSTKDKLLSSSLLMSSCNNFEVTQVWQKVLSNLTAESSIRAIDVNSDGIEDILFGFGTGDNTDLVPANVYCKVFMGTDEPFCQGGVIALNGHDGNVLWTRWLNSDIYSLQCVQDVNYDDVLDCLAIGVDGTITFIDGKNGSVLWSQVSESGLDVYAANFIPDQNNDSISDILATHTPLKDNQKSEILLLSGKDGNTLNRSKLDKKTFYMPQLLKQNDSSIYILLGTGTPTTAGELIAIPLQNIFDTDTPNNKVVLYKDNHKGIMPESILVDITGDAIPDIIASCQSHVIAINGKNFQQIWNWTVTSGVEISNANILPTPAFFNHDDVLDFMVVFLMYDNITNTNFTQTFVIDGKSGKSIYDPMMGTLSSQMSALTLSMQGLGYDMFLFWTVECKNVSTESSSLNTGKLSSFNMEECRGQFNGSGSSTLKLNALSQFDQPPGLLVFGSENFTNFENYKSILNVLKNYLKSHASSFQTDNVPLTPPEESEVDTYDQSSVFRHRDNKNERILKDFDIKSPPNQYNVDYDYANGLQSPGGDFDMGFNQDDTNSYPYNRNYYEDNGETGKSGSRDPRSKPQSRKKQLSDPKNGIYGYKNIQRAKNRLFEDTSSLPTDILRDTLYKYLRGNKFQQRDTNSKRANEEIEQLMKEHEKNASLNLWDLESETEIDEQGGKYRERRQVKYFFERSVKITTVGSILDPINKTNNNSNEIDVVVTIYWQRNYKNQEDFLKNDLEKCVSEKSKEDSKKDAHIIRQECISLQDELKEKIPFYDQLFKLKFGELAIYRLRVRCICDSAKRNKQCAQFLNREGQRWNSYLGEMGDGYCRHRNYG